MKPENLDRIVALNKKLTSLTALRDKLVGRPAIKIFDEYDRDALIHINVMGTDDYSGYAYAFIHQIVDDLNQQIADLQKQLAPL